MASRSGRTFESQQDKVVGLESRLPVAREQLVVSLESQRERLLDVCLRPSTNRMAEWGQGTGQCRDPALQRTVWPTSSDSFVYMVISADADGDAERVRNELRPRRAILFSSGM